MPSSTAVRHIQPGTLIGDGRPKYGFLILTDDALVHIPSRAVRIGFYFGMIGVLIATSIGKRNATRALAAPPPQATIIPLERIAGTGPTKFRLARNILSVTTTDGTRLTFGVKYAKWQPDLAGALAGSPAVVAPVG